MSTITIIDPIIVNDPESYVPLDPFDKNESYEESQEEELNDTQKLCKKMKEGFKSTIPGLDPDAILEKLAEKDKSLQKALEPIKDTIYAIKNHTRLSQSEKDARIEEAKSMRKKLIDDWKKSQKERVTQVIDDIKSDFEEIKFGAENAAVMIPIIISQIALPTFIGTGAPNPARIAADGMAYKRMLQGMLHPLKTYSVKMLSSCASIGFNLPAPVLAIVESVNKLDELISSIPG